jgi:hypothetical protein
LIVRCSYSASSRDLSHSLISRHLYRIAPFLPRPKIIGLIPASCSHRRTDDLCASSMSASVLKLTTNRSFSPLYGLIFSLGPTHIVTCKKATVLFVPYRRQASQIHRSLYLTLLKLCAVKAIISDGFAVCRAISFVLYPFDYSLCLLMVITKHVQS